MHSLGSYGVPGKLTEDVRSRSVEVLEKRMSEIESLTLDITTQGEEVRTKKGLLTDIVPDILLLLGGVVVRLRFTTRVFSKISTILGQQIPSKRHQDRKGHYEIAACEVAERAKACPLCAKKGCGKVIHTYRWRFAKWPTPDHINWPSCRITSCAAFTTMKPEEREDAVLRLGTCTRCGAYTHGQLGCKRTAT